MGFHNPPAPVVDAFFIEAAVGVCGGSTVVAVPAPGDRSGIASGALRVVPNPSPGQVRFEAALVGPSTVRIYDMVGRLQREIDLAPAAGGTYRADWDGRDSRGIQAPAGVYWARIGQGAPAHSSPVVIVR